MEPREGNSLPLRNIPLGFTVHNVETTPGSGGKLARSAGTGIQLTAKEDDYAILKMPSGEIRKVHLDMLGDGWHFRKSRLQKYYLGQGWSFTVFG